MAIAKVWRSENKKDDPESLRQAAILFEPSARAAIEAMRTPTDGMMQAFFCAYPHEWEKRSTRL